MTLLETVDDVALAERVDALLAQFPPATTEPEAFLGAQFDAGLAWVHFPEGCGGLGLTPALQAVVAERLRDAGAPTCYERNPIGFGMAAPTLVAHGSADQRSRYLRRLFTGEDVWCQLFSEPGAGSDVASLATRAVRDGDVWRVTGQKVWTSFAHVASYGLLLARTDPSVPKHQGMTYFVIDMHAPGVEVRPLRQITGDAEFNEVYLTDAVVPEAERLGEEGAGWRVALTTLANERVLLGGAGSSPAGTPTEVLLKIWEVVSPTQRERLRAEVTKLYADLEVNRLTSMRAKALASAGTPGPEGSISKLAATQLNQRLGSMLLDLLGAEGMLVRTPYENASPLDLYIDPAKAFLRSRGNTIEGGTSEIMRNILAERMLGLPAEPRVDRDVPWRDAVR
ncbi:MAG TPA: acyl-CoA dehydrogenase family protein [Acidimicrobiales bacterium]|nr:acyl-CoA dehydrogenase family protein [Acidimicrobiales bacterium]